MLMDHRNKKATLLCSVFSVETGEKAEKEPEMKETEKPEEPKKSATKKEKKPRVEEGFQIWTELETQRNKFMVTKLMKMTFHKCHSLLTNSLIS